MIKIENIEIHGWEPAIRGMRNPKNSWAKSDSEFLAEAEAEMLDEDGKPVKTKVYYEALSIGPNDHELMMRLKAGGPVHAKYRRMLVVYADITAPLYWWKEYDTYKVGTVANSCSTMHKIQAKKFTLDDFSHEHLLDTIFDEDVIDYGCCDCDMVIDASEALNITIKLLNLYRKRYLETKDKKYWWQMIQLLPSSYNQKRTVMLTYEVLAGMDIWRQDHKLDEWREFCKTFKEQLPYSEIFAKEK